MIRTSLRIPKVLLVADLGSSASKFFYRVGESTSTPLWMGAEVAPHLSQASLPRFGAGGRPQDDAWLQIGQEVVLVGDVARTYLEGNSLTVNKAELAAYKLAAVLGVVAELENSPKAFDALVWLALPLTELGTRDEIRIHFQALCQQGFSFRGQPLQIQGSLQVFPEGFGLYLNRKQQLKSIGQAINQRRTLIVMMGHRNLSVLRFEAGSLKAAGSSSNGPGFWPIFEKSARSLGVTKPDYGALMNAIVTGQGKQISAARGRLFDFNEQLAACRDNYWQAVKVYWQDHVMPQLESSQVDVIISGGASQVLRSHLEGYFSELGLAERVYFADGAYEHLDAVVKTLPEAAQNGAMALRMADGYGLFRGLIGTLNQVAA